MVDTFTGWIEVFPTQTEKAEEVVKTNKQTHKQKNNNNNCSMKSFQDLIWGSLQSENRTSFTSKVTQGVSKTLSITYYLHCAWRPWSNISDKKITQDTFLGWKEALPRALLHTHVAPKEHVGLSPRPFVYVNDLTIDLEIQTLQSYTMAIGQLQQDICFWGMNQDPKDYKGSPLYAPGTQVLIKVWKDDPQRLNSSPHARALIL